MLHNIEKITIAKLCYLAINSLDDISKYDMPKDKNGPKSVLENKINLIKKIKADNPNLTKLSIWRKLSIPISYYEFLKFCRKREVFKDVK